MKKLFSIVFLFAFCLVASAQYTTPKFGTLKNQDNTGRALTYGLISPAYAASVTVIPKWYDTTVKFAQLTGNLTLIANVSISNLGDKLGIIFNSDATDRTVSFSTGFVSGGSILVPANATICLNFTFNGVGWVHVSKSSTMSSTGLNVIGNITTSTANVRNNTGTAIPITATITAAQLAGGLLTTTSAAAVTMTLPTATQIATQIGATQGTIFEFVVDNSAGANTVTVAVGSGITASGFPATNTLTLAASATVGTAVFRLTFISATAATLTRIN